MKNVPLAIVALAVSSPAAAQVIYQTVPNAPQPMNGGQVVVVGQQPVAQGQVIITQPMQQQTYVTQPQAYQATVPTTTMQTMELPSGTSVSVVMNQDLSSSGAQSGDRFAMTVIRDIVVGGYVMIPRGTPAHGQITYRTGKGAFGKSGKMEIDITDLDLNGQIVPLSGHFREEGQGNPGATVGVVLVAGVFGAFVTGHSSVIRQGREFEAFTREPLSMQVAVQGTTNVTMVPQQQPQNPVMIVTPVANGGYIRQ